MVLRAATVPCRSPALQVISYRTNSIRVPDLTLRKSTTFLYTTKKKGRKFPTLFDFAKSRLHFLLCITLFCPKFHNAGICSFKRRCHFGVFVQMVSFPPTYRL